MFLIWPVSTVLTLKITLKLDLSIVIVSIPVSQLTVEQAHKEFNSLADKIAAKYDQLDSGNLGQLSPQHLMLNPMNWLSCLLI